MDGSFKNVCQLFEEQVNRNPNAIALIHNDKQSTYLEINTKANQLANFLKHKGIKFNDLVVLMVGKNAEYLISILAVWKVGGSVVTLNPEQPNEENQRILDKITYQILLTTCQHFENSCYVSHALKNIYVFEKIFLEFFSKENLPQHDISKNLAYITFTYDRICTPKCVMIFHEIMLNQILEKMNHLKLKINNCIESIPYQFFYTSINQLMAILLMGEKIQIIDELDKKNINHLFFEDGELCSIVNNMSNFHYLEDGGIKFLSCDKEQISDFIVDTDEIEARLNKHPYISKSIVTIYTVMNKHYLVVYFTCLLKGKLTLSSLRRFLLAGLPSHAVPRFFIVLSEFPLTDTGEVNRAALPQISLKSTDNNFFIENVPLNDQLNLEEIINNAFGLLKVRDVYHTKNPLFNKINSILLKNRDDSVGEKKFKFTYINRLVKPILGYGMAPATFGELMQGVLPDDRNFLVTLPIKNFATVCFEYSCNTELSVFPPHKVKSLRMVQLILDNFGLPHHGKLTIYSSIPEAKGLASSSADLVATARAVASSLKLSISHFMLETFMSEIEPSDGVVYDGCVSYYQKEALLRNYLGLIPAMTILALDEGGEVDTIHFNSKRKNFSRTEKIKYLSMLNHMERAVRQKNIKSIGQLSTDSARYNQKLRKNKYLDHFIDIGCRVNCAGVVIAHSGTYIGLLFDTNELMVTDKLNQAKEILKSENILEEIEIYTTLF